MMDYVNENFGQWQLSGCVVVCDEIRPSVGFLCLAVMFHDDLVVPDGVNIIVNIYHKRTFFHVHIHFSHNFFIAYYIYGLSLYPSLYNIVQRRDAYVAIVLQSNPLNIQFRRTLAGNRWEAWLHIVRTLMDVHLSQQPDQLC